MVTMEDGDLNLDVSCLKFYEGSTYLQKAYGLYLFVSLFLCLDYVLSNE